MHEETALSVYVSDSDSNQLNQLYHMKSTFRFSLNLTVSSADHLCKQFGPRSGPT